MLKNRIHFPELKVGFAVCGGQKQTRPEFSQKFEASMKLESTVVPPKHRQAKPHIKLDSAPTSFGRFSSGASTYTHTLNYFFQFLAK